MNKQREIIYGMRRQILDGESQADTIEEWIEETTAATLDPYASVEAHPEDWDLAGLVEGVFQQFGFRLPVPPIDDASSRAVLDEIVLEAVRARYAERERELGIDHLRMLERHEMLIVIDQQWKDHLLSIDHLKEGIGLRGYGQRDPLTEYKREAFDLFQAMVYRVKTAVVERLFKVQVMRDAPMELPMMMARADFQESRGALPTDAIRPNGPATAPVRPAPAPRTASGEKVGRNDPCPCGSGKKYKKCCYLKGA
jgi:preprotein translocase subunit SecA